MVCCNKRGKRRKWDCGAATENFLDHAHFKIKERNIFMRKLSELYIVFCKWTNSKYTVLAKCIGYFGEIQQKKLKCKSKGKRLLKQVIYSFYAPKQEFQSGSVFYALQNF